MNAKRKQSEALIYKIFDTIDPSGANSEFYKNIFSGMSDAQYEKFISGRFPFRFQNRVFEIEPKMADMNRALKILKVPMLEKINLNYYYKNEEGKAIQTKPALVIYVNVKKMKQFITKKNHVSLDTSQRDVMGRLTSDAKGGQTSDREFECLAAFGLDQTLKEMSRPKADAVKAKNQMYNNIYNTGMVSMEDIEIDEDDNIAKNTMNTYLIGSHLNSNLINKDYMLPYTIKDKHRSIEREE